MMLRSGISGDAISVATLCVTDPNSTGELTKEIP